MPNLNKKREFKRLSEVTEQCAKNKHQAMRGIERGKKHLTIVFDSFVNFNFLIKINSPELKRRLGS